PTPTQVPIPAGPPVVDVEIAETGTSIHAIRADGSGIVWGGSTYDSAGNGVDSTATAVVGVDPVVIPGEAVAVSNSSWNGLALVRPRARDEVPGLPQHVFF